MTTDTATRVRQMIADVLCFELARVTPEMRLVEDLSADSLDAVGLLMAIEEEFGVEITDAEAEAVATVADAIALVERRVG